MSSSSLGDDDALTSDIIIYIDFIQRLREINKRSCLNCRLLYKEARARRLRQTGGIPLGEWMPPGFSLM